MLESDSSPALELGRLALVRRPEISAVQIRRESSASARADVQTLLAGEPFQLGAVVERSAVASGVREMVERLRSRAAARALAPDITALAGAFLEVSSEERVRVQLELLRRDACRRFHYDNVPLRLLCTYAGPGTEWVDDAHVDAAALEQVGVDIQLANARIVPDPARIMRARSWDVLLLKGGRYPGRERHGAVHRSPPIEAQGLTRLVLRIDGAPVEAPDACAAHEH